MHEDFPKKMDNFFASQPPDQGRGGSNPPRLPRYFGLPMVHPGRSPLPLNRPYYRPLNYPKYANDYDPYVHVRVFKATIRASSETNDAKIVNLFSFTLKIYYV